MQISAYIIDDFYSDVDEVREFALQQDFSVTGNYPGPRTKSFLNESVKETIENVVKPFYGNVTFWGDGEYTGAYQFTTSRDRSWIHADQTTKWAAVCYLTPNAPLSAGTGLFKHKATGLTMAPRKDDGSYDDELLGEVYKDAQDMTKWDLVDSVANVYNRLILYRGDHFHMSMDYFGQDVNDGRLFQTFFFNTEL
jgi:hypothetical protein|tara:strand:- start:2577 stop:3161 length:585 start_codon:yes stop_codon:yes gene_type:complete